MDEMNEETHGRDAQRAAMRALIAEETKSLADALAACEAQLASRDAALRARRARHIRMLKLTAGVAALASTLWVTKVVVAQQTCVPGTNQTGVLNALCAQSPARAGDLNHNFTTIRNWITSKLGDPSSPHVTVNGNVSSSGTVNGTNVTGANVSGTNVSATNLSSSGPTSVGANLTVNGRVSLPCSGCGDGGGNWGNVTMQGRVISASDNLHLSPPGGRNVIINGDYRAAGGGTGNVGLSVSGNIYAGNNGWDSNHMRGAEAHPYSSEPTGNGWGRHRQACNNIAAYTCPDGQYVCGIEFWHGCAWSWYDEVMRVRCCTL